MTRSKWVSADPVTVPKQARKYFRTNRRVLLVGVDKVLRQMLAMILESNGFEVTAGSYDLISLEQLRSQTVDFMLLELRQADSPEVYATFQTNPAMIHIPVIVIITSPDEKIIKTVSQLGVRHFLSKPFTENELLLEILTLLMEKSRKSA